MSDNGMPVDRHALLSARLAPVVGAEGVELVEVVYAGGHGRGLVRLVVDKAAGVTLDDCARVSRVAGAVLDHEDLVQGPYTLEVSSPGLDRPLRTDQDFQKWVGHAVELMLAPDSRRVAGRLVSVAPDVVGVETERGEIRSVARAGIRLARPVITP